MMRCDECNNKATVSYCGFKEVTKEKFDRALRECKDLKFYCTDHRPKLNSSKFNPIQIKELPSQFTMTIENDLDNMIKLLPDFLEKKYDDITNNLNFSNPIEFLTGWCMGICESSYLQTYLHDYRQLPTEIQTSEMRNIISSKKIRIEDAITLFLREKERRKD